MQHGDLSNQLPPRWLIVFEGVIGTLPTPRDQAALRFWLRTRAWRRAVHSFTLDPHTIKVLWDMTWRQNYKFDVVTYLPVRCTEYVREWLDEHNIPVANVWHRDNPGVMARELAFMPDVHAVVHADVTHRFTYGHKGFLVTEGWRI